MSSVGRSSLVLATGTATSRVLGFVKAALLAVVLGNTASQAAAAFNIANTLPNQVYVLVAGGVLSAVLVPQIVQASKASDGGQAFVSKLITLGSTLFLGITIVATIASPLLVDLFIVQQTDDGGGFTAQQVALAVSLAYWCMPQIFFYALYTILGEIFNARSQFGPYTWAPVVNNVVSIVGLGAFLLLFGGESINRHTEVWGPDRIILMGAITTGGVVIQAVVLVLMFRRTGLRFRPDFRWRGVGLRSTGTKAMWIFGVALVGTVKGIIQTNVASAGAQDSANVATLNNAWYVFSLPHAVITISVVIAFFTRMSQHAADDDIAGLRADLAGALRGVGMLTTISAVVLAVVSVPFWRMFEPRFEWMVLSSTVLWALLVCLVAFSAEFVIQRVFFALGDTRTAFLYSIFSLLISGGLLWACTLLEPAWIVTGAAGAIAVANLISASVWLVLVRLRIGPFGLALVARRHVQYLLYAIVAAIPGAGAVWLLGGYRDGGFGTASMLGAVVTCVVGGLVMAVVYFGLLYLTKNPDFRSTTNLVLARLGRRSMRSDGA